MRFGRRGLTDGNIILNPTVNYSENITNPGAIFYIFFVDLGPR